MVFVSFSNNDYTSILVLFVPDDNEYKDAISAQAFQCGTEIEKTLEDFLRKAEIEV